MCKKTVKNKLKNLQLDKLDKYSTLGLPYSFPLWNAYVKAFEKSGEYLHFISTNRKIKTILWFSEKQE